MGLEDEDFLSPSKIIIKLRNGNNLETIYLISIFVSFSVLAANSII